MKADASAKKNCEPQFLSKDIPSHSWNLEALSQYSQEKYKAILAGEKALAPLYWWLGMALNLARNHFARGQWAAYLESLGIERTRASRARAIFRTFSTVEQVTGLAVEKAYSRRQRKKQRHKRASSRVELPKNSWKEILYSFGGEVELLMDTVANVTPKEAASLLTIASDLICRLQQLEESLRLHAAAPASDRQQLAVASDPGK